MPTELHVARPEEHGPAPTAHPDPEGPHLEVLLTGATGFVGKVVLAELLRRRDELGIARVWLAIRPRRGKPAQERFDTTLAASPCFARHEPGWQRACQVVAGDLCDAYAGLRQTDRALLADHVTHIIHCAASVDFDLPIAEAARANIQSALNVLELAQSLPKLRAMVDVSTAYVTPHRQANGAGVAELVPLPRPASVLYQAILDGQVPEKQLLAETGHPNTYTYTKCLAEHLLSERKGSVPLTIVRPSIVSAAWEHPFAGWIDSHAAFAGFVALFGMGYLHEIVADPQVRLDLVPVDVVAAEAIDAALQGDPQRPIRYAAAGLQGASRIGMIVERAVDYYSRHPAGRRVTPTAHAVRTPVVRARELLRHTLPTQAARAWLSATGRPKQAKQAAKLSEKLAYLNQAFPAFSCREYAFAPCPPLPAGYSPEVYVDRIYAGIYRHLLGKSEREVAVAGRRHAQSESDLGFALGRPRGGLVVRSLGYALRKALRRAADVVTFDRPSFEAALAQVPPGDTLVVVPTHRSYLDSLLCSYLFFAEPALGVDMPLALPQVDHGEPDWHDRLSARTQGGAALQFFVEGGRGQARRFHAPSVALLRALQASGRPYSLLPVAVAYDRMIEERLIHHELHPDARVTAADLLDLAQGLRRRHVELGRVHLAAGAPVRLTPQSPVRQAAQSVLGELQRQTVTTTFHLRAFLARQPVEHATLEWLRDVLVQRGLTVLDSGLGGEEQLPATVEGGLRHHWRHALYPEALVRWPEHPVVAHHVARHGAGLPGRPVDPASLEDPRLPALLDALFLPLIEDVARVLQLVGPAHAPLGDLSLRQLRRDLPEAPAEHLHDALALLSERGILMRDHDLHDWHWGPAAETLADLAARCGDGQGAAVERSAA